MGFLAVGVLEVEIYPAGSRRILELHVGGQENRQFEGNTDPEWTARQQCIHLGQGVRLAPHTMGDGTRETEQLGREGVEVEREARPVTVHRFDVWPPDDPLVYRTEVACSSGP